MRRPASSLLLALASLALSSVVAADNPRVLLETTQGDITVELYPADAPETVSNFLLYVREGFYDGTIFHRVIPGFVVQGGGYTTEYTAKETRAPIRNEAENGLGNDRGTIAMARTSEPHSATSQFYFNLVDNGFLDQDAAQDGWGYCVFGKATEGLAVVDAMAAVPTDRYDIPLEVIVIDKASVLDDEITYLQKVYVAYYGRPGDPAGVGWWAEQLAAAGGDLTAIIQQFGYSDEFNDEYGSLGYGELIDTIYRQMLNREPDDAGRAFYLERLESGEMSLQTITLDVLNGAQGDDARIIANKVLVASLFTDEIAQRSLQYTAADIDAARGVLALVGADPASVIAGRDQALEVLDGLAPVR